ncbi:hypothetical protein IGI37_001386 [Enterococcus sp. AZ194]|uniref:hypothetical protein n=1 Tax=Enterococcus sp. AZ194 TaxID=2774629 RepID=UPI003F262BA7
MNRKTIEKILSTVVMSVLLLNPITVFSHTIESTTRPVEDSESASLIPEVNSATLSKRLSDFTSESGNFGSMETSQNSEDTSDGEEVSKDSTEEQVVNSTEEESINSEESISSSTEENEESVNTNETETSTEESTEESSQSEKEAHAEKIPTATSISVATGAELQDAYNNPVVTSVTFTRNITVTGSNVMKDRSTSFTIE